MRLSFPDQLNKVSQIKQLKLKTSYKDTSEKWKLNIYPAKVSPEQNWIEIEQRNEEGTE